MEEIRCDHYTYQWKTIIEKFLIHCQLSSTGLLEWYNTPSKWWIGSISPYPFVCTEECLGVMINPSMQEWCRVVKTSRYPNHVVDNPKILQHDDDLITGVSPTTCSDVQYLPVMTMNTVIFCHRSLHRASQAFGKDWTVNRPRTRSHSANQNNPSPPLVDLLLVPGLHRIKVDSVIMMLKDSDHDTVEAIVDGADWDPSPLCKIFRCWCIAVVTSCIEENHELNGHRKLGIIRGIVKNWMTTDALGNSCKDVTDRLALPRPYRGF